MESKLSWSVVEYNEDWTPRVIATQRGADRVIFKIKDLVTNGTKMRGKITHFQLDIESNEIFIYTDWSGVGMNLDSVEHVKENKDVKVSVLPSAFQPEDFCVIDFLNGIRLSGQIIKVAFTKSKVTYDIEITVGQDDSVSVTRLYGVDSTFVRRIDKP